MNTKPSRHTEYIYHSFISLNTFVILVLIAEFLSTDASTSPVIYSLKSTVTAVRGSDVTLVCKGSNVRQLDSFFKWKFNNVTEKNKVTWLPGNQASFSLDILNVSEKDVGDYRCIVHVGNMGNSDKAEASIKLRLYESSKYNFFTFAGFISKSKFCVNVKCISSLFLVEKQPLETRLCLKWSFARV